MTISWTDLQESSKESCKYLRMRFTCYRFCSTEYLQKDEPHKWHGKSMFFCLWNGFLNKKHWLFLEQCSSCQCSPGQCTLRTQFVKTFKCVGKIPKYQHNSAFALIIFIVIFIFMDQLLQRVMKNESFHSLQVNLTFLC